MEKKKSLLERYQIPISHLDFAYIEECKNGREMEKILQILQSGEEGFYPDLNKCAEEKLRQLKPNSRLFRVEEKLLGRDALSADELKPIYVWNQDIKNKDHKLQKLADKSDSNVANVTSLPPVRRSGKIQAKKEKEDTKDPPTRIKSTDYSKWDKYDADEEVLRMELAEERIQEDVERKNRLNANRHKPPPTVNEIQKKIDNEKDKLTNLTDIEKEKLSDEYRLRGNEYFRAKEFDNALVEYTRSIQIYPEKAATAYNNRALTYFKLKKFYESMKDSEACLALEPNNIKARIRLAEAHYAYGRKKESYDLYLKVLEVDGENAIALKAIAELRQQYEELPPPKATRLQIQDESSKAKSKPIDETPKIKLEKVEKIEKTDETENTREKKVPKKADKTKPNKIKYDLAELIKPNRIVKNKLITAAENLCKMHVPGDGKEKAKSINREESKKSPELILPMNVVKDDCKSKLLIEELYMCIPIADQSRCRESNELKWNAQHRRTCSKISFGNQFRKKRMKGMQEKLLLLCIYAKIEKKFCLGSSLTLSGIGTPDSPLVKAYNHFLNYKNILTGKEREKWTIYLEKRFK
uniref:TPR_REGION domain-containing protein n=1 Tax=Glossina austeni TaxID=7395 RepID=A0A1A9VM71_GLOAU